MDKAEIADLIAQVAKQTVEMVREGFAEEFGKPIVTWMGKIDNRLSGVETEIQTLKGDVQHVQADLQTFKSDMSSEFFTVKRKLEDMGKDIDEIRKSSAMGINAALGEAFDQGGKAADIFKAMRRTQKDHEKRLTALEQAKG